MTIRVGAKWLVIPAVCIAGAGVAAQLGARAVAAALVTIAAARACVGATKLETVHRTRSRR